MKAKQNPKAVVLDLEFTAWEGSMAGGWSRPGEYREVVQIGAVKLDAARLKIADEFSMLVRPRINPVLSEYFAALTGIGNARLQREGVDFITAYEAFLAFVDGAATFGFGRDDLVLEENLKRYVWGTRALPRHVNVVPWLAEQGLDMKGKNACHVAEAAGLSFEGHAHDALADAKGVAAGLMHLIAKGAPNLFLADTLP